MLGVAVSTVNSIRFHSLSVTFHSISFCSVPFRLGCDPNRSNRGEATPPSHRTAAATTSFSACSVSFSLAALCYPPGVDPSMDPELAMALRVSMEEERARQEAASKATAEQDAAAAASASAADASPSAAAAGDRGVGMETAGGSEESKGGDAVDAGVSAEADAMQVCRGGRG